jgi:D-sedoheptulose 7-phosphate isomerase
VAHLAPQSVADFIAGRFAARNEASRLLFDREAGRLAEACEEMASRFLRGGRLLAFGRGASTTDAQHVSVEFVHPVIVGKRALPALDLSVAFETWLPALVRESDIAMGFSAPEGDMAVQTAIARAHEAGAQTFALPGRSADFALDPPSRDAFVSQELIEILYHTLWETVHVFFEHSAPASGGDIGASGFLYPFLDPAVQHSKRIADQVADSIRAKAADVERLRTQVASEQADAIAAAIDAVAARIQAGGTLLFFGNGGSATDANDWAIDCASADAGLPVPAVSLSMESANITAIANDIGTEAVFLRQLIAQGKAGDVAVAISTSGGSANVIAALDEARKRGLLTVALLGYDGGEIVRRGLADLAIVVDCDYIPRIQEVQASVYHVMTEAWRQWPASRHQSSFMEPAAVPIRRSGASRFSGTPSGSSSTTSTKIPARGSASAR